MDSHSAATLAFGTPSSRSSLSRIFGTVARTTRRVTSGRTRATTHRRRKKHHRRAPVRHHVSGVVIPKDMLKMLVFVSVIDKIRGGHSA